ncbi:uncharacterized protein LOC111085849 [Limulus polyphemus]|uniref:Uncharacterized protein LOC111085849 n=1 Tax=Limulus polyphemus TaxID=6850 RepID=A0ABM1SEI3_LIMPO|nr:uncharacterized protein LOC111085849 [Limulus polyphemus]
MKVTWVSALFLAAISATVEDHSWTTKWKTDVHVLEKQPSLSDYVYDSQEHSNKTQLQDPLSKIMEHVTFQCESKVEGYYADKTFNCEVFHYCKQDGKRFTFLCPPKSIFNQKYKICDYKLGSTCGYTEEYLNLDDKQDSLQNITSQVDISIPTTDSQKHSQTSKRIQRTSFQDQDKLEEQFGVVNSSLTVLITQPGSERNNSSNPPPTQDSQMEKLNHTRNIGSRDVGYHCL